ncbi:MAG: YihY/virulence factor BrkB family protein [Cyanobacteria bacterium P01_H01_bin.121]
MIKFIRQRLIPAKPTQLLICTVLKWQKDSCPEMGAALSYYALFSLFPVCLVILSIAGFLLGPETQVFGQIMTFTREALPPQAADLIQETLLRFNRQSLGVGLWGFLLSFFTASHVFGALDRSVDKIWKAIDTHHSSRGFAKTALAALGNRIFAFTMVLSTGGLLILSLIANIAVQVIFSLTAGVNDAIPIIDLDQSLILKFLQSGSTLLLLTFTVLMLFKLLPSTRVTWGDIWLGSSITALLLMILQRLVTGSVITIGGQYQSYGVIGSVMVLMFWVYLTCQVFFLGCEFTYVYAYLFGSRRNQELNL